jgi:hypothetical protein
MKLLSLVSSLLALLTAPGLLWAGEYRVDIGGPMDKLFIQDGWYVAEGPYDQFGPVWRNSTARWGAQGAQVRLPVFPDVTNTVTLRAEVPGTEQHKLFFIVNGEQIAALPIHRELLYSFAIPAEKIGDRHWITFQLKTNYKLPPDNDSRDRRAAVDWIKVSADAPERNYVAEMLKPWVADYEQITPDQPPLKWRMHYDPNNIGDSFTLHRYYSLDYDDTTWPIVPSTYTPDLMRGEAVWYRTWLRIENGLQGFEPALHIPGNKLGEAGRRRIWVNGKQLDKNENLKAQIKTALGEGCNLLVVKCMKGPLPRPEGDPILEQPKFLGKWTPDRVKLIPGTLILKEAFASTKELNVSLVDPQGNEIASEKSAVMALQDNRRGVRLENEWALSDYGRHTLKIADNAGHVQQFPVHFLGAHFFHWGWYIGGPTQWRGFKPCSNDYIDQLFERIGEWKRPHHSISWGGAIFQPGTGFHLTPKVDYIAKFRTAIAEGQLDFVGMPYPPRNICTDFGESLLKSMRWSRELYKNQLKVTPDRFTSHDSTMTPLLPQIMQLCGYDTYVIAENWWGQGQSIPNSRDCFFANAEGSRVRIMDSWYHGISPVTAAKRAVQQGKPAVLCNEEFACLDRTVFLEQNHLDTLAEEGIFLQPITLDKYQQVTRDFARERTYQGDENLCYKGWTGGGEGEVEYEKAARLLETRLMAWENLASLAGWVGEKIDREKINELWDMSFRLHECHRHWVNGYPDDTRRMREGVVTVDENLRQVARRIASRVSGEGEGVVVFNPLGFRRSALVRVEAPEGTVALIDEAGEYYPLQQDPDVKGKYLVALTDLPAMGYRRYKYSGGSGLSGCLNANDEGTLSNGIIRAEITEDGRITSVTDVKSGEVLMGEANALYFALPKDKVPEAPLSSAEEPLNFDYYCGLRPVGKPRVIGGFATNLAAVEYNFHPVAYPKVTVKMRFSLARGERKIRVRTTFDFPEPAVVFAGGKSPHEGVYFPGIFAAFDMPPGAKPMADMAYCVTDGVLSSTNHSTFMKKPFRNGTFNALSLAGPNSGEYAVLTRGLPDFFVLPGGKDILGLSFGVGAENSKYHGQYVHEYAVFVPAPDRRASAAQQSFRAARSFLIAPVAVNHEPTQGSLPAQASLLEVDGSDAALIAGSDWENDQLNVRVINLTEEDAEVRFNGLAEAKQCEVLPRGKWNDKRLKLGPRAVRELRIKKTSEKNR